MVQYAGRGGGGGGGGRGRGRRGGNNFGSRDVRYSNSAGGGGGGTFCKRVAETYILGW